MLEWHTLKNRNVGGREKDREREKEPWSLVRALRDFYKRMLFWWNNFCQHMQLEQEWLQLFLTVLVREDIWEDYPQECHSWTWSSRGDCATGFFLFLFLFSFFPSFQYIKVPWEKFPLVTWTDKQISEDVFCGVYFKDLFLFTLLSYLISPPLMSSLIFFPFIFSSS